MAKKKLEKDSPKAAQDMLGSAELHKAGTDLGKQRLGDPTDLTDCAQLWARRAAQAWKTLEPQPVPFAPNKKESTFSRRL